MNNTCFSPFNYRNYITFTALIENIENIKNIENIYCHSFFNTIQSNLSTECIEDQFLKDCTSKHEGPIVSYKGFYGHPNT